MKAGDAEELPDWLLVGSSGRVGRMLRSYWRSHPPLHGRPVYQTRRPTVPGADEVCWSPLDSASPPKGWTAGHGKISTMLVFAGVTPGPGVDFSGNVRLAEACLAAAAETGIPRVLVASSAAVYGAGRGLPFPEGADLDPVNDYGRSKVAMEAACASWRERGLEVACLRIGNVAGADALLLNARAATAEQPLRIDRFADGRGPLRSYVGPATLARVLETLSTTAAELPEALNIAAPGPVEMQSLAESARVPWVFTGAPAGAIQCITLDCAKLAGIHTFAPEDSLAESMVAQCNGVGSMHDVH